METNEDGYIADETGIDFAILQFFGVEGDVKWEIYAIWYIVYEWSIHKKVEQNIFQCGQNWTNIYGLDQSWKKYFQIWLKLILHFCICGVEGDLYVEAE